MQDIAGAWRRPEHRRGHSHTLTFFLPFFLALSAGATALIYGVAELVTQTLKPIISLF